MRKILALTVFLSTFYVPLALAAGLTYIGSSTIGTGVLTAGAVEAFEKKTGITFSAVEIPGSGKGIQALLEGKTTLAGGGRPLKAEEKKQKLLGTIIGYDAIAVFVHRDNPVTKLSKAQLKGIFTGEITNWKQVGGKDAPITPNTEILTGKRATVEMFQELVMDGAPYGKGFREIDLPRDQIVDLAANPDGICSVSLGLLTAVPADLKSQLKAVMVDGIEPIDNHVRSGAYLISRPLLLVTRGLPKGEAKEFLAFIISPEGQKIVGQNFVPVRK